MTAQTLSLQIRDGRVTLDARGVSVRQILDEWARQGQVTIVNPEALASTPTTIVLNGVSEQAALETILRDTAGYILGPRPSSAGATQIDRIFIVPPGAPVRTVQAAAGAPARPQPQPRVVVNPEPERPSFVIIGGGARAEAGPGSQVGAPGPLSEILGGTEPATTSAVHTGADGTVEEGSTMLSVDQRPPTPIFVPPSGGPTPQNPFGTPVGSSRPGTITPVGPPPGVTNPQATRPEDATATQR